MTRRLALPGADELFRTTGGAARRGATDEAGAAAHRRPSGRQRHDEKITVYVSGDELMDLERARLALRGDHAMAVDRGRIVREALAVVLADFAAQGEDSVLVRRLRSQSSALSAVPAGGRALADEPDGGG